MPRETRKAMLKEATELAKKIYCVDEPRDMEKVYKVIESPNEEIATVLNGIIHDMADFPEPPHVPEDVLRHARKDKEMFDPEYLWTGTSGRKFAPEETILTGKFILDRLAKVKRFLGRNPEKALVFVDDDGYYLVKERPTTLREVKMLRDMLVELEQEEKLQETEERLALGRQKMLQELVDAADKIGIDKAIKKLKKGP